jgi:hypothetical protein
MSAMREQMQKYQDEVKLKEMLEEQKKRLEEIECSKKSSWNSEILTEGGISTYAFVDSEGKKRKVKVSVQNKHNDVTYKFHFRKADGIRVSVNCKTYKDAQIVIDSLFGKGHYRVSASII